MPGKKCPLCNQGVSDQLFEKITGIWKAKEAEQKELAKRKKDFFQEQKEGKRKLALEKRQMMKDQKEQIETRVKAETKKFEAKIKAFDQEKKKIQDRADKKILAAVKSAEQRAKAQYQTQMKEQLQKSVSKEVKKATAKLSAEKRKSDQTLASTLRQIPTLQAQVRNLQRQLKNKTTPQLEGLLYEETLMAALQKEFPGDKFKNTGKGGDILHDVVFQGDPSGVIVYECKKVSHWSGAHVDQTATAKSFRNADFGILVTNAVKKGTTGFFIEKGVIVVNPGGVLAIANVLRDQLLKMAQLKLSKAEREEAIGNTLKYLQGPEFKNSLDVIIRKAIELNEDLKKEYDDHMKNWKKRQDSLKVVYLSATKVKTTTLALISGKKPEGSELDAKPFSLLPELKETREQK